MTEETDSDGRPLKKTDALQQTVAKTDDAQLRLVAEELAVTKELRETGRARIATHTREREALVDENLIHEHVEFETVPVGQRVFVMPIVRQEGDTTIVPIVEEVLYTERRLMLKEEIRITRVRTTERYQEPVTLRYQEAVVTRTQNAAGQADAVSKDAESETDDKPTKLEE